MEFKEYIKIFKKYSAFILLCVILGAVVGFFSTNYLPQGYRLTQTLIISGPQPAPDTYNYEGFYSQERARNFTDTAVAILESGDFQKEIPQNGSLEVKKLAPQVIRLTVTAKDPATSKDLMQKTQEAFNKKYLELAGDNQNITLKPIASPEEPAFQRSSRKIYAAGGAIIGLALSIAAISLKSYFRL